MRCEKATSSIPLPRSILSLTNSTVHNISHAGKSVLRNVFLVSRLRTLRRHSRAAANNTVFIVDPSLKDHRGHHANTATTLTCYLQRANIATLTVANHRLQRGCATPAFPHFTFTAYDELHKIFSSPSPEVSMHKAREKSLAELMPLSRFNKHHARTYIFPTVTPCLIESIADFMAQHSRPDKVTLALWLLFDSAFMTTSTSQEELVANTYANGFKKLAKLKAAGLRVSLITETPGMRSHFEIPSSISAPILQLPVLHPDSIERIRFKRASNCKKNTLTILFAGAARNEKGFHLLPGIIERVTTVFPNARFIVQTPCIGDVSTTTQVLAELSQLGRNTQLLPGDLPATDYTNLLAEADIVLLPYCPVSYSIRGSGMATEAQVLGIPCVAPASASFTKTFSNCDAIHVFAKHSIESIANATIRAAQATLKVNERQITHFSESNTEKFLKTVLGLSRAGENTSQL